MEGLLNSSSWRMTAPLRSLAASLRLTRRRIRRVPEKLAARPAPSALCTAGLFPPDVPAPGGLVTGDSPLLAHPELATDRRQPRLHGARSDARMLVVAHVYYPEVWFDIEDRLVRLPEPYDLVVSLVEGRTEVLEPQIAERLPHAIIHHVQNHGRDLGPLVELAGAGVFDGYDAILKVHTKRSPHRVDGDAWRVALLDGLLPSPEGIRRIIELLRTRRSCGPRRPEREPPRRGDVGLQSGSGRGAGRSTSDRLRSRGAALPCRLDVLGAAVDSPATRGSRAGDEHFEPEASHVDGSTAHALERFVGVGPASGLDVSRHDVPSRLRRARRRPHRRPRVLAFYLPHSTRSPRTTSGGGRASPTG